MEVLVEVSRRSVLIAAGAAALAGCDKVLKPDPALVQRTEEAYVLLIAGRHEELFGKFTKSLQNESLATAIIEMQAAIPPGQASGPPMITGWQRNVSTEGGASDVILTYNYPDIPAYVTVEGHFKGSDKAGWELDGFHVTGKRGKAVEGLKLGDGTITPPPKIS